MTTRDAIVTEARTWMDTRFRNNTGVKGIATDCIGLVAGVGVNVGIFPVHPYLTPAGMKFRSQERRLMEEGLQTFLIERPRRDAQVGDVALTLSHGQLHIGILAAYPLGGFTIIHAYAPCRRVVETRMDDQWMTNLKAVFSYPGVTEC
jgi:hypothetical protein